MPSASGTLNMMFKLIYAAIGWLLLSTAQAVLDWERQTLEFQSRVGEQEVTANFAFKNTGTDFVRIDSIRTSCGCTTAALEKRTYLPGETGKVVVKFKIGERKGNQLKQIRVQLAGESSPTILTMIVHIVQAVEMNSSLIFWEVGEELKEKFIELKVNDNVLPITDVKSSSPVFRASLKPSEEVGTYILVVRPTDTGSPLVGVLDVNIIFADGRAKEVRAFAQIRRSSRAHELSASARPTSTK
jgi:hypothetical protein